MDPNIVRTYIHRFGDFYSIEFSIQTWNPLDDTVLQGTESVFKRSPMPAACTVKANTYVFAQSTCSASDTSHPAKACRQTGSLELYIWRMQGDA